MRSTDRWLLAVVDWILLHGLFGEYRELVIVRGWAPDRYEVWLAQTLKEQLLGETANPIKASDKASLSVRSKSSGEHAPESETRVIIDLQRGTPAAAVRLEELLTDVGLSQGEAHGLALLRSRDVLAMTRL
jgi:hypothetical protein